MANFNIRQTSLIRQEDKILIPLSCPKVMRLEKVRRSVVLLAEILVELLAGTLHEGLKTFSLSSIAHCVSHFRPLISFMTVLLEEYTKISKREPRLLCSCWTQRTSRSTCYFVLFMRYPLCIWIHRLPERGTGRFLPSPQRVNESLMLWALCRLNVFFWFILVWPFAKPC